MQRCELGRQLTVLVSPGPGVSTLAMPSWWRWRELNPRPQCFHFNCARKPSYYHVYAPNQLGSMRDHIRHFVPRTIAREDCANLCPCHRRSAFLLIQLESSNECELVRSRTSRTSRPGRGSVSARKRNPYFTLDPFQVIVYSFDFYSNARKLLC